MSGSRLGLAIGFAGCFLLASCDPRDVELAPQLDAMAGRGESSVDAAPPEIPGLLALRVSPARIEVTYDGAALAEPVRYSATGSFADGDRDVTDQVAWSLTRAELGAIDRGRFETAGIGGETRIVARASAGDATAELRVRLDILLNPRELAPEVLARFEQADDGDGSSQPGELASPQIVYPASGSVVPSNLAHLHTQWQAPSELDAFELSVDGPFTRLRYYTDQRSWFDEAISSRYLAPSHPGSSVSLTVRGLTSRDAAVVYRSPPVTVKVAQLAVSSAAYYWSTTARGIKRGHLAAATNSRIATEPTPEGHSCGGCHALSRDGSRLAYGNASERLALVALPEQTPLAFQPEMRPGMGMPGKPKAMMAMEPPIAPPMMPGMPPPEPKRLDYGWGSWKPDGTHFVYADKGKLRLINAVTGQEVGKVDLPPGAFATQPDWAPDGRAVAVTYLPSGKKLPGNKQLRGTSIARLPVRDDGTFAPPELIVVSEGPEDTLHHPSYSPDSRWLAFVRSTGTAKDNPTSQVQLVPADGSTPPLPLENLNRMAGLEQPSAANSLPTWMSIKPEDLAYNHEGIGFLVFSSERDYGQVLIGTGRDQLWASAIDFRALADGADPSAPPFWLPFQDPLEDNHRALWSTSERDVCPALTERCDGRDEDCDGAVDEGCCNASEESCGDGIDNDCDGVPDEGCGCATVETCGDKLDDDCDLKVDEDCRE